MDEENQLYTRSGDTLIQGMEVCDLPPTEEEIVEKAQVDGTQIKNELNHLQKSKQTLQNQLAELEKKKNLLENEAAIAREKTQTEINKLGDIITKKVAALEVYKQIRMTNFVMIGLILPFLAIGIFIKSFNLTLGIIDLVFIAVWGWHFIMNKKKMQTLKTRYAL